MVGAEESGERQLQGESKQCPLLLSGQKRMRSDHQPWELATWKSSLALIDHLSEVTDTEA